jgi:hypothetical protein
MSTPNPEWSIYPPDLTTPTPVPQYEILILMGEICNTAASFELEAEYRARAEKL